MTQQPDTYRFEESPYDFDDVLLNNGFILARDLEQSVIFEKPIFAQKEFDPNVIGARDLNFKLNVIRPKILVAKGNYDLCSPYSVNFLYNPKPLLMYRRVQWDTFPGYSKEVLTDTITQCEAEAEALLTMLLDVDSKVITMVKENQQNASDLPPESPKSDSSAEALAKADTKKS